MEFRIDGTVIAVNVADAGALLAEVRARFGRGEGFALATINLDHVVKLRSSAAFRAAYAAQDLVVADGNPIVWLSHLAGRPVELAPGADMVLPLAGEAARAGVTVALENIFDRDAWALRSLLAALPAAQFGWLLDLGHWHAYSYDGLMPWLEALGERLVAVHVHDNGGRTDDHRALGAGSLPGDEALAALRSLRRPLDWVLENRSVPDLETSIRYLADRSGIAELEAAGARLEKRGARGGRS